MLRQLILLCLVFVSVWTNFVECSTALSLPIEGRIESPGGVLSPSNQEITLNGGLYGTLTRVDGSFTFYDIPTGIYLLDVSDIRAVYPQMKIKLSAENGTITVVEYKYVGAKRIPAAYPMVITAIMPVKYFQVRPPLSIMSMITGNPMMIMMVFMLVMIVAFPNMLAGMSPEDLQELKKSQATAGDPMKELSKLMGVGGATAAKEDEDD